MKVKQFIYRNLQLVIEILKNSIKEMYNIIKEIFGIIKRVMVEIGSIFKESVEFVIPIFEKILYMLVRNALIVFILTSGVSLVSYMVAPELFYWVISRLGVPLDELKILQNNKKNLVRIHELSQQLEILEKEKNLLHIELSKSVGEKNGIVEGLKSITLEKINWWNVILTVSGITIVGGGIVYFFFNGSDAEFFKPVIKLLSESTTSILEGITSSSKIVNTNVLELVKKIEALDEKIDLLKNIIDLLSRNKSD